MTRLKTGVRMSNLMEINCKEETMKHKRVIELGRIRKMEGTFAFIPHRFIRDGFWESLSPQELVMYMFLVMVADRNGMSFYGEEKIRRMCKIKSDYSIDGILGTLEQKELIAQEGIYVQVLSLPQSPVSIIPMVKKHDERGAGPVSVKEVLDDYFYQWRKP